MARHLSESNELQKKIVQIQNEIKQYSDVISVADGDDREVLQDHVKQLQAKLEMTVTHRKKVLRQFYTKLNKR